MSLIFVFLALLCEDTETNFRRFDVIDRKKNSLPCVSWCHLELYGWVGVDVNFIVFIYY